MARILAVGGAHIDRRGRIDGPTRPGASNPGRWFEEPGGGVFNAARSLARLGHEVTLVSPRGGDAEAEIVARAAEVAGIRDLPLTFLDRRTPSYTAILEEDGNLAIALADMELYRMMVPRRLTTRQFRAQLDNAEWVLTDANLPADTLQALAGECARRELPLAGIAISPAKAVRFRGALAHLAALFMNEAEAMALVAEGESPAPSHAGDWPGLLASAGLSIGVVTRGRLGAVAYDTVGASLLAPHPIEMVGDVTGAGDAMAAGFLDGMIGGLTIAGCLKRGTALAGLTVRSPSATLENLDRAMLERETALVPDAADLA